MKTRFEILIVSALIFFQTAVLRADEGMWIPLLLEQLNQKEMQDMGMRITAKDIYDINHSSLKDAILLFGRGCTAEIISDEGLVLTNHHCGYRAIQSHSTIQHDYLTDGFWAMNRKEELPNPGLTVTRLVRMEDVTLQMLRDINDKMTEKTRDSVLKANEKKIVAEAEKDNKYKAYVRPFYYGNEFYLFVTEVFKDIRLVGAPPSDIGKFGGDTDNWMWPRHTGDFSLFRIYVNTNNEPAEYSEDNVPYKPLYSIPVSLKGVKENDFTFIFGFPGRTQEYVPSDAIEMITQIQNPTRIALRRQKLDIYDAEIHGSLKHLASTYNMDNDILIPGIRNSGPRVLDFANILQHDYIPLAKTLVSVLEIVKEAMGTSVEIEFAVDLNKDKEGKASFYFLQIKPLLGDKTDYEIDEKSIDFEKLLLFSEKGMGNGHIDNLRDIIYVDINKFDKSKTLEMAEEIALLNDKMKAAKRKYVLIGPGRWGTRDPWIGIPVKWSAISNAKVIVETNLEDFPLDSSSGSHFFHNVISMNVGYLSVNHGIGRNRINYEQLNSLKPKHKTKFFRHIQFEKPLTIKMDGKKRIAFICPNEG